MSFEITAPEMSAVDTLADLWVELARDQRAYGSHLLPEENRTRIRESLASHVITDGVRVARDPDADPSVVGFVMFGLESDSYERDAVRGTVENVFVRPARRNAGVGAALMDAAEASLAARGADAVSLEAMAANAAGIRFYRRRGYDAHRVVMEKSLDDEDAGRDGGE